MGTNIIVNSLRARGLPPPEHMTEAQLEELIPARARAGLVKAGALAENASADDLRQLIIRGNADFRDKAPVSAAEAATIILDGVRAGSWRVLIGEDARTIDAAVRAKPEAAYDYADLFSAGGKPFRPFRRLRAEFWAVFAQNSADKSESAGGRSGRGGSV